MLLNQSARKLKHRLFMLAGGAFALILLLPQGGVSKAVANGDNTIIMVEEDWQLILNEPGTLLCVPQLHTAMSPHPSLDYEYAQVLWNYRENPDYRPGGLQIEAWRGDTLGTVLDFFEDPLSNVAETITWTQRLTADGTNVFFELSRAHSTSWGDFGGDYMSVRLNTPAHYLNDYTPNLSQQASGITFGANRVNLLVITEVRKYTAAGLFSRSTDPIVIYQPSSAGGDGGIN